MTKPSLLEQALIEKAIQEYVDGTSDLTLAETARSIATTLSNPCSGIFDHKWLSPSCVAEGCRSLNTRRLLDEIKVMEHEFTEHTNSWLSGFARARKMAADLVRATLDPPSEPPMASKASTPLEIRLFDALKRIKAYQTPDQLRRWAEREYGCDPEEAIAMAYENMQQEAAIAIKGVRIKREVKS